MDSTERGFSTQELKCLLYANPATPAGTGLGFCPPLLQQDMSPRLGLPGMVPIGSVNNSSSNVLKTNSSTVGSWDGQEHWRGDLPAERDGALMPFIFSCVQVATFSHSTQVEPASCCPPSGLPTCCSQPLPCLQTSPGFLTGMRNGASEARLR